MTGFPKTLVIAEAGVNHNGSLDLAKKLVREAKEAGADIVKFQTFKAENLVTKSAQKAKYQTANTGSSESQFEMLKKLELSFDEFKRLAEYCSKLDIEFLSTAFDAECLEFLVNETKIKRIKVPSGELTNGPLLAAYAQTQLPLIISTGMATMTEIECALDVMTWARSDRSLSPANIRGSFKKAAPGTLPFAILHCTTEYPAPFAELNLKAMLGIADKFKLPIGLSDHSEGIIAPVVSVAMGATIIEKHFTTSQTLPGPDHTASLEPDQLHEMVRQIRLVETMLGSGFKNPTDRELANAQVARKSLVAKTNIAKGDSFSVDNLVVKRPGTGLSPMAFWDLIGKGASKAYATDELIAEDLRK